jgi:hypothetical protein
LCEAQPIPQTIGALDRPNIPVYFVFDVTNIRGGILLKILFFDLSQGRAKQAIVDFIEIRMGRSAQ